jgi:PilZ domain-containing protein
MQRREHHRVRLRLPARIRWATPLGQQTESCVTLDVSRGGLLLRCKHPHQENSRVWVTFPFDASAQNGQPEVSARVVRCKPSHSNAAPPRAASEPDALDAALCFDRASHVASNGNGKNFAAERRATPRHPLSFPLRVRPEYLPWFEETMTTDASSDGLRFLTTREYAPSDRLFISFDAHSQSPWPSGVEIRAHIVRVESLPGKTALAVVVQRVP